MMSAVASPEPARGPGLPLTGSSGAVGDTVFQGVCSTAAASVIGLAGLLFCYVVIQAWPAIQTFGWHFLVNKNWEPPDNLGALSFIYGTVYTSLLAMLFAVPLGVATAAYLAEIAPPLMRRVGAFLVELLAAIPSVVYGFWAIQFLGPLTKSMFLALGAPPTVDGDSLFTASLILAIMILPYITAITFDVCRAVPHSQREGSLALGATRWQTIARVVLPYARPGIVGGCFLALGRALGETMAVIMVIGNTPQIRLAPYEHGMTIPSKIAMNFNEVGPLQRSALAQLGAILLLVTIIVNVLARLMIWQMGRTGKPSPVRTLIGNIFWSGLFPVTFLAVLAFVVVRLTADVVQLDLDAAGEVLAVLAVVGILGTAGLAAQRWLRNSRKGAIVFDRVMTGVLSVCLFLTCVPLFLILGYITIKGAGAVDLAFFTNLPTDEQRPGLGHAVVGTAILVALATVLAVPIGLLAAIFLVENPNNKLTPAVRFVGELLAGVPSIIIGIFGYALLVNPDSWLGLGHFSAWAGSMALAVMMLPVVMRGSEEAMKLVPKSLRHASYALGAARWQTVMRVTVPAAMPAIITAVCLSIARIAGETAPLLLTANMTDWWPDSLNQRFPFLTYYIYYYSTFTSEVENRLAWAAAFVLLTVVMAVNVGIRLLTGKRVVLASRAD
jgi:phosphate transport system permease protein